MNGKCSLYERQRETERIRRADRSNSSTISHPVITVESTSQSFVEKIKYVSKSAFFFLGKREVIS